jgi:hypothetical protein
MNMHPLRGFGASLEKDSGQAFQSRNGLGGGEFCASQKRSYNRTEGKGTTCGAVAHRAQPKPSGRQGLQKPRFYQTKPFVMLKKSYLCGTRRMGCVDYRKMTNGFVFSGPEERPGDGARGGRSEYNNRNGVGRPRRSVALQKAQDGKRAGRPFYGYGGFAGRTAATGTVALPGDVRARSGPERVRGKRPGRTTGERHDRDGSTSPAILRDPVVRRDSA